MTHSLGRPGEPDDDLRRLFQDTTRSIHPTIHQPPVRDVIARARGTRRQAPAGKPAPLAAILALGATPLVVLGAVLIGPAGADIFTGTPRPLPERPASSEEPLPPLTARSSPVSAPPTSSSAADGAASAVTPLTEVTVYFADGLLVQDGCRRLTAATRLVPEDQLVAGTLRALIAGPRADERAAGLVNQFAEDGAAPPLAITMDSAAGVVVLDTDETFFGGTTVDCRYDDISRALDRTTAQFEGWSVELRVNGSREAAATLVAEDPTGPVVEATADPSSVESEPSAAVATTG